MLTLTLNLVKTLGLGVPSLTSYLLCPPISPNCSVLPTDISASPAFCTCSFPPHFPLSWLAPSPPHSSWHWPGRCTDLQELTAPPACKGNPAHLGLSPADKKSIPGEVFPPAAPHAAHLSQQSLGTGSTYRPLCLPQEERVLCPQGQGCMSSPRKPRMGVNEQVARRRDTALSL